MAEDHIGMFLEPVGPGQLAEIGDEIFFLLSESGSISLWKSDGTPDGSHKVISLNRYSSGRILDQFDDLFFFTTRFTMNYDQGGGSTHNTLWVTDGTETGTVECLSGSAPFYSSNVRQGIRQPGPGRSGYNVIGAGDSYFLVKTESGLDNSNPRVELWLYKPGWSAAKQVHKPADHDRILLLCIDDGRLFYALDNQVWITDGGTPVMLFEYYYSQLYIPDEREFLIGDTHVFVRQDPDYGWELWSRDSMGERMVKDIEPGRGNSSPTNLTFLDGSLVFIVRDRELWISDGTENGTKMLAYSVTSSQHSYRKALEKKERTILNNKLGEPNIFELVPYRNKQVFVADNRTGRPKLFITDGTEDGTEVLFESPSAV